MKTALIIATYNWPEALKLVLESIKLQTVLPDEVIIADDGSKKETFQLINNIKSDFPIPIKHIWHEDKGFRVAMIRNKAIAATESEYIIGIDGDMILHPKFIEDHKKHAKKNRYIQGGRVLLTKQKTEEVFKNNKIRFSFYEKGLNNRKNAIHSDILSLAFSSVKKTIEGIRTCNFSIYKEDLLKINGFDNEFVGWGREDSEMVARFLNSGGERYNLKFNAIAYHLYHKENERKSLLKNDMKLNETIKKNKIWCENGINKFLKESSES